MSEHEALFWQTEAQNYRLSVAESVGRIHALVALGLPILVTAGAALIAAEKTEYLVVITPIVLLVWALILNTNQDILLKSAYQYRAEKRAGRNLRDKDELVTWEDVGGSVGWLHRTSAPSFWMLSASISIVFLAISLALVGVATDYGLLFWIDVAVVAAGAAVLGLGWNTIAKTSSQVFEGFGLPSQRVSLKESLERIREHDEA